MSGAAPDDAGGANNLANAREDAAAANASGAEPCPINTVKPKIAAEHKVVLLDRKLWNHQSAEPARKHLRPDPTYLLVWATQSNAKKNPFKKTATLEVSPANVEIFLDEKCKKKLNGSLEYKQLTGKTKLKLWLRGVTAGKFTVKLTLADPENDKVLLEENPAELELGVVETVAEVFQFDKDEVEALKVDPDVHPLSTYHDNLKNEDLPDQKVLSDEDKVQKGRLLHQQKDAHFGRSKVVLKKLEASQWPDGTDDYEIVLDQENDSGALAVFDKEFDGTQQDFPVKVKVSDLKAAEKTFWVEGSAKTKDWRGARIDLGLDRAAEDLPKKRKRYGDWARFTVVEISDVKVQYKAETGKTPAWDKKTNRFYVNLKDDPDGRKVTITAKVAPALKGILVRFMLAPDKENLKSVNGGTDPTTWEWKDIDKDYKRTDKKDRKDVVHLAAETDTKGRVKQELILSRCGGHKFTPGCYIDQDPHLGKYVDGHTDLEKRKPVQLKDPIEVWRKVWYQIAKPKGCGAPRPTLSESAYANMKVDYKTDSIAVFKRSNLPANLRDRTFYPEWMIVPGGGTNSVAVVGGHNWQAFKDKRGKFFPMTKGKKGEIKKLTACIVVIDHQWDPKVTALKTEVITKNPSDPITMSKNVVKPALSGALIRTGTWKVTKKSDSSVVDNGTFTDSGILIEKGRASNKHVKVKLPASVNPYLAADKIADYEVEVSLKLGAGQSYLGESDGADIMAVYDSADASDYHDTISHETSHSLGQTFDAGDQPTGLPDHPYRNSDQGTHCSHPHTPSVRSPFQPMAGKTRADHECIMYESGPVPLAGNKFCKTCAAYLLIQEMTTLS